MRNPLQTILSTRPDPLDVLTTTAYVVPRARCVKINRDAIERAADALAEKQVQPPAWNYALHFFDGTERTVNYLFLLDALNFCFWGEPKWRVEYRGKTLDGYWALAASLKRALEADAHLADADFLARIMPQELADILRGSGEIPLFTERWRNVRELGTVLRDRWNGSAARLVESAQGDAARLAQLVVDSLASFHDVMVYETSAKRTRRPRDEDLAPLSPCHPVTLSQPASKKVEVRFYKRAQILVADLWGAFGGKQWGDLKHLDELTAFADYKLPQILRAWGVLEYAPSLARQVNARIELAAGSAAEVEIRAATLWAVEFLRDALAARGRALWSMQVDWILWEASQKRFANMRPYHRVRTIYY